MFLCVFFFENLVLLKAIFYFWPYYKAFWGLFFIFLGILKQNQEKIHVFLFLFCFFMVFYSFLKICFAGWCFLGMNYIFFLAGFHFMEFLWRLLWSYGVFIGFSLFLDMVIFFRSF